MPLTAATVWFTNNLQVGNRARCHGIGRHSSEEIQKIGCDDVQAISDFLGDKPFMMGDKPTLVWEHLPLRMLIDD